MQRQKVRKKQHVGTSNVSHICAGVSRVQMSSPSLVMKVISMKRGFYTRRNGIQASVEAIMTALNIPVPIDPNICNVQRRSSILQRQSTPNMFSMAPDQSTGEYMTASQRLGGLQQSTSECLLKPIRVSIQLNQICVGEFFWFIAATLNLNYAFTGGHYWNLETT